MSLDFSKFQAVPCETCKIPHFKSGGLRFEPEDLIVTSQLDFSLASFFLNFQSFIKHLILETNITKSWNFRVSYKQESNLGSYFFGSHWMKNLILHLPCRNYNSNTSISKPKWCQSHCSGDFSSIPGRYRLHMRC